MFDILLFYFDAWVKYFLLRYYHVEPFLFLRVGVYYFVSGISYNYIPKATGKLHVLKDVVVKP